MPGLFAVLGVLLAAQAGADEAKKGKGKGQPAQTPEAIFKRLDTNGDGKLSRQEFRKLGPLIARRAKGELKDKPQRTAKLVERLFNRLDINKDGYLSLEEFKKFRDYRRQLLQSARGGRSGKGPE
jgi:hypothetical protein